jgi:prefoldin subunit 5
MQEVAVIFNGLNRHRVGFLFHEAVGSAKLKQFLDESRLKLMPLGAEYHKRKRGGAEELNFILRLPPAAEPIVRAWFRSELECTPTLQPEALVAQFEAVERDEIKMPEEKRREFAIQGLAYLVSDNPPATWTEFLASEIGEAPGDDVDVTEDPPDVRLSLEELAEAFEGVGGAAEQNDLHRLIGVFLSLQVGDAVEADRLANSVEDDTVKQRLLGAIVRHREAVAKSAHIVSRPRQVETSSDVGLDDVELIGLSRPRSSEGSPAFIRIVAFRDDDTVYLLGDDQLSDWLGGQHEVIGFPDTRSVRLPKGPELGAWVVENYSTTQAIKVRVKRNGRPLYTLLQINAERGEPDGIREAIRQAEIPPGARPVFLLTDGSAVCLSSDVANLAEHEFDEPLEWFRQLQSWEIAGRHVALGPLPPPDEFLDCSDITSVLKRLLRSKDAQAHLPKMTQAQIQGLVNSLRAEPGRLTLMRIERVQQSLSKFAESTERLTAIVPELLSTPNIRAEVDEAKKTILAEFVAEQSRGRAERDRLTKEISDLNKKRVAVEEEIKKTAGEVRKAVRKSFEKARDAGASALGDVAVLSAVLGSHEGEERNGASLSARHVPARASDLARDLGALGAAMVEAKAAELFVKALLAEGLPLLVRGPLAGHYGLTIGAAVSVDHAVVVDVPLGVLDGKAVASILAEAREGDAIVVTGFNLSPYESYGAAITDRILQNFAGAPGRGPHVILAAVEAPIGLPVPGDVEGLSATLDTRWLVSGWEREGAPSQGRQFTTCGGNVLRANALGRVATAVATLDDPYRRIANAFLARQGLALSDRSGEIGPARG